MVISKHCYPVASHTLIFLGVAHPRISQFLASSETTCSKHPQLTLSKVFSLLKNECVMMGGGRRTKDWIPNTQHVKSLPEHTIVE